MRFRHLQFFILVFAGIVTISVWMPTLASPRDSSSAEHVFLSASGQKSISSVAAHGNYVQRGDWEPPDILLVVENSEWPESIEGIVRAARQDGTPAFVLIDRDDFEEDDNMSRLNEWKWTTTLKIPHDTPWIRDYGPLQLKTAGNNVRWIDFEYGGDRPLDDSVPREIADQMGFTIEKSEYYLDGGAIISNGHGLCAITETSLEEASVDRNDVPEFEAFRGVLGCDALAVIPSLTGESTGHADIIAQFLSPDIAAVAIIDNDKYPDLSAELDQAAESLLSAAHEAGQSLRVVRLPMYVDHEDFYSYINGTRLKRSYLVPSFSNVPDEIERMAYKNLMSALPGVILIPIPADYMAQKGGAVHCITLGISLPSAGKPQYLVRGSTHPDPAFSPYAMNIN